MILIAMGSNLTTSEYLSSKEILEAAIELLSSYGIRTVKCSNFYETEPVPKSDQPWFVNAVISVKTRLNAHELLNKLHHVEQTMGRIREKRWEARIIDLDLLCYHNEILPEKEKWHDAAGDISSTEVVIPHGRLHERDFVLIPMADIAPDWVHPILGKNVNMMLNDHKSASIVRLL